MTTYRSALGKPIDMASMAARNEKVRAVGNMKVNARGDTIDSFGRVIEPATSKVNQKYSKTVGNRTANTVRTRGDKPVPAPVQEFDLPDVHSLQPDVVELTEAEKELELEMEDDLEVEEIKIEEVKAKKEK